MAFITVDLPAPLGPISAVTAPRGREGGVLDGGPAAVAEVEVGGGDGEDLRMITILHIVGHMRVLLHDSTAGVEADEMVRALVSGLLVVAGVVPRGHLGGAARPHLPRRGAGPRRDPRRGGRAGVGRRSGARRGAERGVLVGGHRPRGPASAASGTTPASGCCSSGCCPSGSSCSLIARGGRWSSSCSATSPTSTGATSRCRRSRRPGGGGEPWSGYRAFLALSFHEGKAASLGLRPHLTNMAPARPHRGRGGVVVHLCREPARVRPARRSAGHGPAPRAAGVGVHGGVGRGGLAGGGDRVAPGRHYDTAVGATMAPMSVGLFFVVLAVQTVREERRLPARLILHAACSHCQPGPDRGPDR